MQAVHTSHAHARRYALCDHCGAPIEVPIAGGKARCGHCGAEQWVRMRLEAALKRPSPPDEAERLARLTAQDHFTPLPAGVLELVVGGRVLPSRIGDALALWQRLRASLRAGPSFAAAEQLFHLTLALAERALDDGEWLRQRALCESALELLEEPRHQQVLRAYLSRGACRAGDLAEAERWLSGCDPTSDDLPSDTAYRFARAYLDTARAQWPAVIHVLGASSADLPLWDTHEAECAVLRANAWERLGQIAFAIDLLMTQKQDVGPAARTRGRRFIALHPDWQLCAQSEREAESRFMALAPSVELPNATGLLVLGGLAIFSLLAGVVGVLSIVPLAMLDEEPMAGVMLALYGFIVGGILFPLWFGAFRMRRAQQRTRSVGRQASAHIASVTPSGEAYMPGVNVADVSFWVFPDDAPAYMASFKFAYPHELAERVRVGRPMLVRINPADPSDLEVEAIG